MTGFKGILGKVIGGLSGLAVLVILLLNIDHPVVNTMRVVFMLVSGIVLISTVGIKRFTELSDLEKLGFLNAFSLLAGAVAIVTALLSFDAVPIMAPGFMVGFTKWLTVIVWGFFTAEAVF